MYLWNRLQWGPHFRYDYFWGHRLKSLGTLALGDPQGSILGEAVTREERACYKTTSSLTCAFGGGERSTHICYLSKSINATM